MKIDYSRQGWNNQQGDEHFQKQRRDADDASIMEWTYFYSTMQLVGDELQAVTDVLTLPGPNPEVLDIGMARGGYSASELKYSPHTHVSGITLPRASGGHQLMLSYGRQDPRVDVLFTDITMLAAEYGVTNIPEGHPTISNFSTERP